VSTLHSKDLPDYITSETPQGLRRSMFRVNAKYGASHKFFDIQPFKDKKGKTKWIAWFYRELKQIEELE
jgi:hypothetical protein